MHLVNQQYTTQTLLYNLQHNNYKLSLQQLTNTHYINDCTRFKYQHCLTLLKNIQEKINKNQINWPSQQTNIQQSKYNNNKYSNGSVYHPKIVLAIYSIVIMKDIKQYNTKVAIQFMTRYYRALVSVASPVVDNNTNINNNNNNNKTLSTITSLLLRIPTFSNYKLIIKHIDPTLVPVSLLLQHREHILKQCPNLFQQYILKKNKEEYIKLITMPKGNNKNQNNSNCQDGENSNGCVVYSINQSQNKHMLDTQFKHLLITQILQQLTPLTTDSNFLKQNTSHKLSLLKQQLQSNTKYLHKRIKSIICQQINIENVFQVIVQIVVNYMPVLNINGNNVLKSTTTNNNNYDNNVFMMELIQMYKDIILELKNQTVLLLCQLVRKLGYKIIRKISVINQIISNKLNNYQSDYQYLDIKHILQLIQTIMQILGTGYLANLHSILFTKQYSILNLVKSLCYNPHYMINPTVISTNTHINKNNKGNKTFDINKQMNVQSKKNNNNKSNNTNNMIALSLKPASIDTPYQPYLTYILKERTTTAYLHQIMASVLSLYIVYFDNKNNANNNKDAGQLLGVLENSKNYMTNSNKNKVKQLITIIFNKAGEPIKGQFWGFCARLFQQLHDHRVERTLKVDKMYDVYIQPTKKLKKQVHNFSSLEEEPLNLNNVNNLNNLNNNKRLTNNNNNKQALKKTQSFDLCLLEGWQPSHTNNNNNNNQANNISSNKVSQAHSSSQIFYSIKQCSVIQQQIDGAISKSNKNMKNQMEEQEMQGQFILTPNFD